MNSVIYNPLEEYEQRLKILHLENAEKHLDGLIKRSGVNIEENRKTVKEHESTVEYLKKVRKKLNWRLFFRVLIIITLILIPLVILKLNPKIKALRGEIELLEKKISELFLLAKKQMEPLCSLFTSLDAIKIIEETVPQISFNQNFSADQEANMVANYDFDATSNNNESAKDILSGYYNGNPFLFEKNLTHKMGVQTYHGYKTIRWTERYRDSDGKTHTRVRTQTLHATLVKPMPYYSTQLILNYCNHAGDDLSFSRDATNLHKKSEREIERYVKRGKKRLKKMTDEAIEQNKNFTSMSNTDFETLFDALDRTNEVQFRTLFTPLAQTNMEDLILSDTGYGDDFNFYKCKRTNKIISQHSQAREITLSPLEYISHSFDIIKDNFIKRNEEYFKAVYFDFAPLWAIPIYQDKPVKDEDELPDVLQNYSCMECEALANKADVNSLANERTKSKVILKASFLSAKNNIDSVRISAYSYDIIPRIDIVPVFGNDGRWHSVPVPWDDYIPLEAHNDFYVATEDVAKNQDIIAQNNNLCLFNLS